MKRLYWILIFCLLGITPEVFAANAALQGFCSVGAVKVVTQGMNSTTMVQASYPQCIVNVYLTGTTTHAPIFDSQGASAPNPFTASTNASWLFYAATGVGVDVMLSGGTPQHFPSPFTLTDLVPGGSGGGGGGNVLPAPQFRHYIQPSTGTQAIAGPSTTTTNAVDPIAQALYNAELFQNGGGNNGILNAATAAGNGGYIVAPPSYGTNEPGGFSSFSGTVMVDQRLNASASYYHNINFSHSLGLSAHNIDCLNDMNFSGTELAENDVCEQTTQYMVGPGYNGDNTFGTNSSGRVFNLVSYKAGITSGVTTFINCFKKGDCNGNRVYMQTVYGDEDGSSEGGIGFGGLIQQPAMFEGTVTTGGTGPAFIRTTPINGTQYGGGWAVNTTQVIDTGSVTAVSSDPNGGPQRLQTSTTHAASTVWGISTTDIARPFPVGQTQSVTVTNIAGVFPSSGSLCIGGRNHPDEVAFTATAASGGSQTITAVFNYLNFAGSWFVQGSCHAVTYDIGVQPNLANQPFQLIGAPDSTHYWAESYSFGQGQGGISQVPTPGALQYIAQVYPLSTAARQSNVITATSGSTQLWSFVGISNTMMSGCSDASFNGQFSGATTTSAGFVISIPQNGANSAGVTGCSIQVTGTSAFHVYPYAEINDVTDEAVLAAGLAATPGFPINAAINGKLTLNYNTATFNPGDNVEESILPAVQGATASLNTSIAATPQANSSLASLLLGEGGRGMNSAPTIIVRGVDDPGQFLGSGGHSYPGDFADVNKVYQIGINFSHLPATNGSVFLLGCAPEDCGHGPPYTDTPKRLFSFGGGDGGEVAFFGNVKDGNFGILARGGKFATGPIDAGSAPSFLGIATLFGGQTACLTNGTQCPAIAASSLTGTALPSAIVSAPGLLVPTANLQGNALPSAINDAPGLIVGVSGARTAGTCIMTFTNGLLSSTSGTC